MHSVVFFSDSVMGIPPPEGQSGESREQLRPTDFRERADTGRASWTALPTVRFHSHDTQATQPRVTVV